MFSELGNDTLRKEIKGNIKLMAERANYDLLSFSSC
jgi:hypothetical protein